MTLPSFWGISNWRQCRYISDARLDCSDPREQMFSSFTHLTLVSHTDLLHNTIYHHSIDFGMIAELKTFCVAPFFPTRICPWKYILIGLLYLFFFSSFQGPTASPLSEKNLLPFSWSNVRFRPILFEIYSLSTQWINVKDANCEMVEWKWTKQSSTDNLGSW